MILSFSKKMIQNTGIRVCYTLDFHTITDLWANEEGLPLMISQIILRQPLLKCAGHGTILAGESPATGIYRQVQRKRFIQAR